MVVALEQRKANFVREGTGWSSAPRSEVWFTYGENDDGRSIRLLDPHSTQGRSKRLDSKF